MTTPRRDIPAKIANREDFVGSHIHGGRCGPVWKAGSSSTGRLPDAWLHRLLVDSPTYIVYSYGTPIAWVASDGTGVVPAVGYSGTTSAHQTLAARGLFGENNARLRTGEYQPGWPLS